MSQLLSTKPSRLVNGFEVHFSGEPGTGHGPMRELYALLCGELFGARSAFFVPTPDRVSHWHPPPRLRACILIVLGFGLCPQSHFHVSARSASGSPHHLQYFEMVGRLLGMSIVHSVSIKSLTRLVVDSS